VWGARTLVLPSSDLDGNAYINTRRLLLTLRRWLVQLLDWAVFEPNDMRLWVRIHRELTGRLNDLFLQGALLGASPDEAFYVKCDASNNPDEDRASGNLTVDVGVAPAVPKEFITIRLVRSADGFTTA
jgi:phage tail sheath protein FI